MILESMPPANGETGAGTSPVWEGGLDGRGLKAALIVSRFNDFFTRSLLSGAQQTLIQHGLDASHIDVIWVPGAFELPLAAQRCAASGRYDFVVALGCVIRGATPHFDYVCAQASAGLNRVALDTGVPVGFGLLTVDTLEQAMERSGTKAGNKGVEAALAALEMANLLRRLPREEG